MELAYLSALLEHRQKGVQSNRFTAIKKFFENAVSVVPLDSLFHAIAKAERHVALQCCELFRSDTLATVTLSSEVMLSSIESVLSRISLLQNEITALKYSDTGEITDSSSITYTENMLNNVEERISHLAMRCETVVNTRLCHDSPYNIDLEVIYPSDDVGNARESEEAKCCKPPITLLDKGKKELDRLSEELIAEHSQLAEEIPSSDTNIKMLSVSTDLREEFETCSTGSIYGISSSDSSGESSR